MILDRLIRTRRAESWDRCHHKDKLKQNVLRLSGGQQAGRISNKTAFFMVNDYRSGYLVEWGSTRDIFFNPKDERTEAYISGRFG